MTEEQKANKIKLAIDLRQQRKASPKPMNKSIKGFRIYYTGLTDKALYPFDYQYAEIFLNLLKKKGLMCPIYDHVYIQVEKNMEDCLVYSMPYDNQYMYGLSVINYDNYINQPKSIKEQIVFDTIVAGLKDIAGIDNLNISIIDETIEDIKKKSLDTELEYSVTENMNHILTITYLSKSLEEECPIYITLLEKSSNKQGKKQIGRISNRGIYYWIHKIVLTTTQIKLKSRNSVIADLYLKDKPRTMEFNITDILNG